MDKPNLHLSSECKNSLRPIQCPLTTMTRYLSSFFEPWFLWIPGFQVPKLKLELHATMQLDFLFTRFCDTVCSQVLGTTQMSSMIGSGIKELLEESQATLPRHKIRRPSPGMTSGNSIFLKLSGSENTKCLVRLTMAPLGYSANRKRSIQYHFAPDYFKSGLKDNAAV
ncbi:hypothetical protein KL911_004575 [Ogataea haglerorum]|uniref:uncharacterized protein n=1 Tax=Ogataea haglerorum TaxID=1937702 RepID=UPI001C8ACC06|nr:uncharacterized protein KL911_004575 [Ogataea haglerorum]KAG7751701.1 hypothetical protein KL911_004575 [Ogataea haglerorum]